MAEKDCVFCKIVAGEIPSKQVYQDEEIIAFHDISPKTPVHILVVPQKHISKLSEADDSDGELLGKIQLVCAKVAEDAGIGDAFRVLNFNGERAGQTVFHIHYHVRGGWEDDKKED